jgi:hypothetical protein
MTRIRETPTEVALPRRARRRGILAVVAVLLAVILGAVLLTLIVALGVRDDLERGRAELRSGRVALFAGRLDEAVASFDEARGRFDTARDRAGSWPGAISARIPLLGRTIDVMAALADAASASAGTVTRVAAGIADLPGGVDGLISADGSISPDDAVRVEQLLAAAEEDTAEALRTVRSSPSGLLPGPVSRARREVIDELEGSRDLIGSARALAGTFPAFAGGTGTRRYLFFAENPAELRGTGGLWGAFALVQARDGRFTVSRFRPVQALPVLPPEEVPVPFPEYRRNYGQYGAPAYWINVNMTPDFPSSARAALAAWEATGRPPLDGVITADPFALRELLLVTGPVEAPIRGVRVTADDVVPFLTNGAFARFSDPVTRKVVLGEAARAVVDRFLAIDGRSMPRLRALARAAAAGHLKVFSSDPTVQSAFARAGVDAALHADGGDLAAVIVNAGAGGKIDFFSTRTVRHDVTLVPGGGLTATTSVTIANDAPTTGQPRYVIGPHLGEAGDNMPLVAVYCGPGCRLLGAERDGHPVELGPGSELGFRFFRDFFTIPSGQERALTVRTEVPDAWSDAGSDGTYRLTIVGQTTIRPTVGTVTVHAPAGMRFTAGSEGIELDGETATWRGVLGDRLELELSLEKMPMLVRLLRAVTGAT